MIIENLILMYILQNESPIFSESFRIIDNILANNGTINFNRKMKENILSFSIHIIRYSHTNLLSARILMTMK